ncbi:MAG: ABC transporter substrate-binding protein [Eubacteriaceae bacterium]|jgi:peptide/nickel transport system substrate-binding protein
MKFTKKIIAAVLICALTCGMLCGCGSSSSSDTLKFGCINYSSSLDPSAMTNAAWCTSRYGIGECLFRFDTEMNAKPYLAESYTVDDAHTTWTFTLRKDVKFSNGNDMTATAVKKSIERMYENEKNGNGSTKPSTFMQYSSISADDNAGTLTIVTSKAYPDLSKVLAAPYFMILDVDGTTDMENDPIGTGPYAVSKKNEGTSIDMVANEHYWQGTVPYKNLQIIFITDNTTKAMSLENGDVDVVENISSATDLDKFDKSSDYNVSTAVSVRTGFAYMNEKGVLANADLRKAIITAIDDKTICDVTVGGMYTSGYSVLPSTLDYGYDQLTDTTAYNESKAKEILDNAGIVDSNGDGYRELDGQEINLNYLTYDSRNLTDFTEADVAALEKVGIKCTINTTDADTEWNKLVSGDYDLLANNWMTVPVGDPQEYLDNWYGKSDANYCGYSNAQYDALYEQLETTTDQSARKDIVKQMQQILIDDSAVLVFGYYNSNMVSTNKVTGATISTADYYWITSDIKPAS